jgi:hypothetical protein
MLALLFVMQKIITVRRLVALVVSFLSATMDIEIPYDQSAHRRRRYRLLVVGVVLIVLIAVVSSRLRHKHAYSDSTSTSRLFVMEIGNLDGNSSKTGTIYIQTMPEWAPIGTDRFHVSFCGAHARLSGFISRCMNSNMVILTPRIESGRV